MKLLRLRLWAWPLRKLQRRCSHPPEWCSADLLEGALNGQPRVLWCRACGAVAVGSMVFEPRLFRLPEPTWCVEDTRRALSRGDR